MADVLYMITILCVCIAFVLMLFAFKPNEPQTHGIRRHNGSNRVWPYDCPSLDDDDTVVIGQLVPEQPAKHATQRDRNFLVVEEPQYLSTGKRSIENPHRVLVPTGWMPPLGNVRIALIDTPTSEYLVARRPRPTAQHTTTNYWIQTDHTREMDRRTHTQLRDGLVGPPPHFVRKYVAHPGMVNA